MTAPPSTILPTVGRKRLPPKKGRTMRLKFAQRLHELAGDRQSLDIAKAVGVNPSTVAGWLSGRKMPDMELWPKLGKTLGLKDYREMLPPV